MNMSILVRKPLLCLIANHVHLQHESMGAPLHVTLWCACASCAHNYALFASRRFSRLVLVVCVGSSGPPVLDEDGCIGRCDIGVVMFSAAAIASLWTGGTLSRTRLWPFDLP
eukprot:1896804-Lingulodinium_polyedra.AAC.1